LQSELDNSTTSGVANDVRACIVSHARGAMDEEVLAAALKGFALSSADAGWEVLSLLDQYHRRGALSDATFRHLKVQLTPIAYKSQTTQTERRTPVTPDARRAHHRSERTRSDSGEPTTLRHMQDREPAQPSVAPRSPKQSSPSQPSPSQPSLDDTGELLFVMPQTATRAPDATRAEISTAAAAAATSPPQAMSEPALPAASGTNSPPTSPPPASIHAAASSGESPSPRTSKQAALANAIAPGKVLDGRYVIESALSFGRCTAIFRARDLQRAAAPTHFVAVKMLLIATPDSWLQFEHEQQIGQRLSHPRLVKTREMQYDNKLPFFAMDLAEGNTLGELLESTPPRRAKTQRIIATLVEALEYLHAQHLAHGDLHPDNLIVSSAGEVTLIDYGAANYFGVDDNHQHANFIARPDAAQANQSTYASCQRLEGLAAEPSDDLFSLACIAYELLAAQHPFKRMLATQARAVGYRAAPVPLLQPQQWQSLQNGLAWERENRTATVAQWYASFSGDSDVPTAQPAVAAPAAPIADAAASTITSAPPRWIPPTDVAPKPSAPQRSSSRTVPRQLVSARQPRRWPLIMISVCSTVAAMVILDSELGTQLRSELARQWQRLPIHSSDISTATATVKAATLSAPQSSVADSSASLPPDDRDSTDTTSSYVADASTPPSPSLSPPLPSPAVPVDISSNAAAHAAVSHSVASIAAATTVKAPEAAEPVHAKAAPKSAESTKANDTHGKISFSSTTFYVSKHDRYAPITITRSNGTSGKVTFVWWTENGSAEDGVDYMSYGKKTEVLNSGKRRMTVFVPLIADIGKAKGHVFFVNLGNASNGLAMGSVVRAKVIIADD
jgi:serine/threonine protein kinase